tara:strand:+ start:2448 stop:3002 length:555 start_codon:yes stop_codon:yes gene_type:complete
MDSIKLSKEPSNLQEDNELKNLLDSNLPHISIPNQDGNFLKLNRLDTFRLVMYCFPMTGRPDKALPKDWNLIPGASGCTLQNCSFRDHYDEIISLNAIPIGISTQSVEDLKEMSIRLSIPYDILSDINLNFQKSLNLPTFTIENKTYIKRLTLIIEKTFIKKIFYPINMPEKHINEVIKWLKIN